MSEIKEPSACPCCAGKENAIAETEEERAEAMAKLDECGCRHKDRSSEELKALLHRLNRIEGQIRGIRKMVESDAYCTDILVQVAAATAALNAFSRELLATHIRTCVADDLRAGKDETVDELVTTLQKLMK